MKLIATFLVVILSMSASLCSAVETGYDLKLEFESRDSLLQAVRHYEMDPVYHIEGVHGNTLKLYTTSKDAAYGAGKRNPVSVEAVHADYTGYYTYETMTTKLQQWATAYPTRTNLFSLGPSVEGRQLWCMEISQKPGDQVGFRPNVKYIGNMHGDEVVGRELLMNFIELLLNNSRPDVTELLNTMNIFIVPTMNPDGFARGTRGNRNGYDLNRNFPDQYRSPTGPEQPETKLLKTFIASKQWTLSANYHGGDLVANYPWDGRPDNRFQGYNGCPDDDVMRVISKAYSTYNSGMMNNRGFTDGITNGAAWYVLYGGMQDFNYIHHGCMEITLEVSMSKWPPGSQLPSFWNQNRESMISYFKQVNRGVRGIVTHANSGAPLGGVSITVDAREFTVKSRKENGAYFRMLVPGTYNVTFQAAGFEPQSHDVVVTANNPTRLNVVMSPLRTNSGNNNNNNNDETEQVQEQHTVAVLASDNGIIRVGSFATGGILIGTVIIFAFVVLAKKFVIPSSEQTTVLDIQEEASH